MLDFLGRAPGAESARYQDAHDAILRAIEHVCEKGPRTRDMGGTASTEEVGRAIAAAI
jgi:tartrate dehydrogenase/decarboxylase/D-malate dehydrogenase